MPNHDAVRGSQPSQALAAEIEALARSPITPQRLLSQQIDHLLVTRLRNT